MMKNNANITIKGKQTYDMDNTGESDKVELFTDGSFAKEGESFFISYNESEITGMEGSITLITVEDDNTVTLVRTGEFTSTMVFSEGKRNLCHYETPNGGFTVTAAASKIINRLTEKGGTLAVNYTLDINNEHMSNNNVYIKVNVQ